MSARASSWAALVLAFLVAGEAAGQTFSPGALSRPHAALDGIENCRKCHTAEGQPTAEPCLACHQELRRRVEQRAGFHGRMAPADRQTCNRCHPEHQGRDFALVDWGPGRERFVHERTGWTLRGKHAAAKCEACHEPRLVADARVKDMLRDQPRRRTFLGLASTPCGACHFDEHRGQEGPACERCHDESGWKPARGFDHAKTAFALAGKHAGVACQKCHPTETDASTAPGAFPPPRATTFARLKGVAHERCLDCHKDPHHGRLGAACESCHTPADWRTVRKGVADTSFHDRTRYPLRGAHRSVACQKCHGPFGRAPAKFVGMAFGACSDCHFDSHEGQLARLGTADQRACDRCHRVEGFVPVVFEIEDHARTRYPLDGAHRMVACNRCHRPDEGLARGAAGDADRAARGGKAVKLSPATLAFAAPLERCETCHADPHRGQFADRFARGGCASCHDTRSFAQVRFDHRTESRFALTGKHEKAPCASCHRPEVDASGAAVVRYKPLDVACASCHRDAHYGQLARGGTTACERCHGTDSFKPSRFDHADARLTDWPLEGRHAKVACEKCHPEVAVGGAAVRRYRTVPRECERCHVDVHRGAFAGFDAQALATAARRDPPSAAAQRTRCAACHSTEGWDRVSFPHDRTGFPLRGRHQETPCRECHRRGFDVSLAATCASCHRDAHAGQLGMHCESCHDERSWRSTFTADAHRGTVFPLTGKHAVIPCIQCHEQERDRSFGRTAVPCYRCHARDFQRAALVSIDHVSAGFGTQCRQCHSAWRFTPAVFPGHDRCFDVTSGPHAGIGCRTCHTSLPPGVQVTGACNTGTAACSSCHAHQCSRMDREHAEVAGYQCKDRRCYECHRTAH